MLSKLASQINPGHLEWVKANFPEGNLVLEVQCRYFYNEVLLLNRSAAEVILSSDRDLMATSPEQVLALSQQPAVSKDENGEDMIEIPDSKELLSIVSFSTIRSPDRDIEWKVTHF